MASASLPQARFVVTGPSGWIGQAVLSRLGASFGALSEHVCAFGSSEHRMTLPDGQSLSVRALGSLSPEDVDGAHVIHLAYLTKEKADLLGERVFTDTNLAIDDHVLAALRAAKPKSLFVASSGAAKLAEDGLDTHPYGLCKLRQEARFLDWAAACGVPAIAGRIFNIAGPFINKVQSYAISNFIVQAKSQGRIRIDAKSLVFRSFLHVENLTEMVVKAALAGVGRDRAVDLCGSEVLEMQDLAELVSAVCGDVPIERDAINFSSLSSYLGRFPQTKSIAMEVGVALDGVRQQVLDTLEWISLVGESRQSAKYMH